MTKPTSVDGHVYHTAGAPVKVFPDSSWAGNPLLGTMPSDLSSQYGTHTPPLSTGEKTAFLQAVHDNFLHINQEWLLSTCCPEVVTMESPQHFIVKTPAGKYQALANMSLGIRVLVMLQRVASTSNGSGPQLTTLVVLVLGPLFVPPQDGSHMGTMLDDIGLAFQTPAKPLGKL